MLALGIASAMLSGCKGTAQPAPLPPPEVSVMEMWASPVTVSNEYVAQTQAPDAIEVRAQVTRLLERQAVADGARVRKGDGNLEALQRFRDLADLRYREATIYLEVATAEQSLFNAQLAYVATQSQLFQSYVNLYKAIGAGWVEAAERLAGK